MLRFLKHKLKPYKINFDKQKFIKNFYIDDLGNAVIKIFLDEIEKGFSEFSAPSQRHVSLDLAEYIDNVIYNISLKYPIILSFEIKKSSVEQQKRLKTVIKNHYNLIFEDKKQDLLYNLITIWILFIIGSALLIFSYFLANNSKSPFIIDLFNIAGTFSLWEMVDLILLDRRVKKIQKLNAAQTAASKIIFK